MDRLITEIPQEERKTKLMVCNICVDENACHLFFNSPFSIRCCDSLGVGWDHHYSSTCKHVSQAKANFSNLLLMEAFTAAAWRVGKQRLNGLIFHQTRPSIELKSRKLASFLISSEQCLPPLLAHHFK